LLAFAPAYLCARAADPAALATTTLPDAPAPQLSTDTPSPALPEERTEAQANSLAPDAPVTVDASASVPDAPPAPAIRLSVSSSLSGVSSSLSDVETLPDRSESAMSERETDLACQAGTLHGKPCRASWGPVLWEFLESTAMENGGNIALDGETRHDLAGNPFLSTWFKCVRQFRYDQWRDDDNFMVDYVAHGMQGGIIGASLFQHSPTGRGLVYVNNGNYWRSRLKGMAWIAVYEVQWKIGPASEASIGNSGLNTYFTPRVQGRSTNETGFQDLVDTPLVGFGWNVGEDAIDRFLMPRIWRHTHNKWALSAYSVLTPCKAVANVLRFKPFYYRDFDLPPVR
jgi:hypothetical protein